ncbi:SETMAR [Cordylochernes scorpioides]|uniref:SETMAR n=1 Tax=Cordylochernes scorpioides TaxID=51811 RepID=A0ABY6JX02_9ARAC|nr:SETMAR [Cordylochernes scorpioides]
MWYSAEEEDLDLDVANLHLNARCDDLDGIEDILAVRFKAGRIFIEDDPRQGRPKFQRIDENVQKITDLINENPRTTLLELEHDTGISKTTIGRIVTEDLKLKKTPKKIIQRFLTNEQKLCRLATCENMLKMTTTDPEWKDKIITGDETWVYGYDPETKRQSAEWRGQDIAPNDLFLFHKLKAVLKGRHFDTRDDIIEKSLLALKSIPKEAYKNIFDNWEKRWRCGDFDTRDKERGGRPIKFEDAELEALLDEDSSQTQEELAETLGVTQQAISNRLKVMGMVQKQGNWVPYELKPGNIERRICTCELLLKRQNRKGFLHRIVTGDEKWIHYDNPKRRKSSVKPGHASTSTAKSNIHGKKLMLCIWWDQLVVIYYELLQPNETITGERYQQQLMRLSRALKIKRPLYSKRHDKVIYQHDNARPHFAKVVKETLEALQWDVLPHPLYSPDIAPSDYHMFRSKTHGLAEQHFTSYEEAKNWVNVWIASKDEEFFRHGIPVKKWAAEFKRGRISLEDDPCQGQRKTANIPETIEKVHNIVLDDRRVKVYEIAEAVGISEESLWNILHKELGMRKLFARTSAHKRVLAMAKLRDLKYDLLGNPSNSPDLASSDFHIFPYLKKFVSGKRFTSNEEVERAVDEYFNRLPDSHFQEGIQILEKH